MTAVGKAVGDRAALREDILDESPDLDYIRNWISGGNMMPAALSPATGHVDADPVVLDAKRFATANRRRLSAPGLRTFLAIADLWGLDEERRLLVLGLPSRSTYYGWVKAVRAHHDITLNVDVLLRISAILGIHQALTVLHETESAAVAWLRTPHRAPPFGGRPPMDLVAGGTQDGLLIVRRFLDAARGGLYMAPNAVDRDFGRYTDADIVLS